MSYSINLTNGQPLVPSPGLSDGTVDNSNSSITLIGRNYAGYGQFLNENFVHMLEHFANNTSPANPLKGQLWWDTSDNVLKVWTGSSWKISTGATSSDANDPPGDLSAQGGDLWYDKTNQQLKVSTGTGVWITVGPAATAATGNTGAFPAVVTDTSGGTHIVIQFTIAGVIYAMFSKDTFTSLLSGFSTVSAGINFSSTASPAWGLNTQSVSSIPNTLVVRDGSSAISAATVNSSVVNCTTLNLASTLIPTGNVSVDLGTGTNWFNNIYGTAIHAKYADLAERFHSDAEYPAGTVVEMGGINEVTQVEEELSEKVFGVISTNAAYLMNSSAGSNATHPPIAMSGRVPVRVTGIINKGDRLVSAGNGIARAGAKSELTPWNVIGRSLVNKYDTAEGVIEAIVKINS